MAADKLIVEAFLTGRVKGLEEGTLIPEHIETMISHVFLFPDTVYKICKRDNQFFNEHFKNLTDQRDRFDFYRADFFQNNYFSPDVYLRLYGLRVNGLTVTRDDDQDGAEDVVMKMRRLELKFSLTNLLHQKLVTEKDCTAMGYQQTKAVALFSKQPKTTENYYQIFHRRLDDLRDWLRSAPDYFSEAETVACISRLRNYLEQHQESFSDFDTRNYVVALDNHSDNLFYRDGKISFLDIYPPKEDWLAVTPWINVYRPATDILLLLGEKYARAFVQGYKDYHGALDESHELFYFLYSAAIQAVSLHNLSANNIVKKEDSVKYKRFIMDNVGRLGERFASL